ncbi:hypothetical protein HK096_005391, partial [Nowakowskiella sp. JEL0078]
MLQQVLAYVVQLVSFSRVNLSGSSLADLLVAVCQLAIFDDRAVVESCVGVLDAVVRFGAVPPAALCVCVRAMCSAITMKGLVTGVWGVVDRLVRSSQANSFMCCLTDIVKAGKENERIGREVSIIRGAVYLLGVVGWTSP